MEKDILLSFVIPVYNVESYLRECVDSILHGFTDECEMILVNDGSKDSSGDICEQYAQNHSRIHVIHKENGGLSSARNAGLTCAKGKYVTFIDSDDKIYSESLADVLYWIKNVGADMCFLRAEKFYPDGTIIDLGEGIEQAHLRLASREDAIKYLSSRNKYPGSACFKLYKRDFLIENDLHFPYDRRYSEDLGFIRDCILCAKNFDALEIPYYQYRQNRKGSITNQVSSKNFYDLLLFITESVERLTVDKQAIDDVSKDLLSFVAYEYCVLLYLYGAIQSEEQPEVYKALTQYQWVMKYAKNSKSKFVYLCIKIFGLKLTTLLLSKYRNRK